ncbi:MAG: DUF202 domain-containing protein [Bacillota bacterium]
MKYKEKYFGISGEKPTAGSFLKVRAQVRAHLSNERTFLAWIRTCLALVAFGVLLVRWMAVEPGGEAGLRDKGGALRLVGESLMGGAAVLALLAAVRFFATRRQIIRGVYRPSGALDLLAVCFLIVVIGVLIYYSRIL